MERNEWAKTVRQTLRECNITLTQFAHRLHYSESHINRVLCGYRSSHAEAAISEALAVEMPDAAEKYRD